MPSRRCIAQAKHVNPTVSPNHCNQMLPLTFINSQAPGVRLSLPTRSAAPARVLATRCSASATLTTSNGASTNGASSNGAHKYATSSACINPRDIPEIPVIQAGSCRLALAAELGIWQMFSRAELCTSRLGPIKCLANGFIGGEGGRQQRSLLYQTR